MKITVLKYDPATDAEPYEVSGEVPYRDKMTALEALIYFHENIQAVNIDYSCACRLCGRCAMMLNGEPCLICVTPIQDTDYTFKPLEGYPVIRDLIVDKDALDRQISDLSVRVRLEPFNQETITPDEYDPSTKDQCWSLEYCCRCGVCNVTCPAKTLYPSEFVGPAGMVQIAYRYLDPLDQGDRVLEAVSSGMYRCIQCGKCDEVCAQQDIDHAGLWVRLREEASKRGLVPSYET